LDPCPFCHLFFCRSIFGAELNLFVCAQKLGAWFRILCTVEFCARASVFLASFVHAFFHIVHPLDTSFCGFFTTLE
jgi:hypothetical protein